MIRDDPASNHNQSPIPEDEEAVIVPEQTPKLALTTMTEISPATMGWVRSFNRIGDGDGLDDMVPKILQGRATGHEAANML